MNKRFWNWIKNDESEERELRIDGVIGDGDTWFEDSIQPKVFRDELNSGTGNITVWINSFGGDVFAASQIYTMLKEYKGNVTVKIDGIAASAASVIAMSGNQVKMSPTSILMLHDPSTFAVGNSDEMKAAIRMLDEIKESIVTAYELKTNLPREKIGKMMSAETWLSAPKAVELGFADEIMYSEGETAETEDNDDGIFYSRQAVTNSFLDKFKTRWEEKVPKIDNRVDGQQLYKRLNLIAP